MELNNMENKIVDTIRLKAREYRDFTAATLSELVKVPSLSRDEEKVIQKIKSVLEEVGIHSTRVDGLGNLIVRIGDGPRILAFDAHIDAVDTGDLTQWECPPFSGLVKDGFVHGRGSVDQKGGAASLITAARILKEMNYKDKFSVFFVFTIMEEDCDGLCWDYLIRKEKFIPDFVVITEPTNLGIYRGHRGRIEFELYFRGISAHASAPERGKNTIYDGAKVALKIKNLNTRLPSDEFLGKGSIAPTLFSTESPSLCAIPDSARMHIDRRLTWGEDRDSAIAEIKSCCDEDAEIVIPMYEYPSYKGEIYPQEKYFPTWKIPEEHPFLKVGIKTYKFLFNLMPRIDKWTFSTNGVTICGRHKIPCIGLGPGNEIYAHSPNEKIPINDLEKASAFYALLPWVLSAINT